jgi:hypothetical protein
MISSKKAKRAIEAKACLSGGSLLTGTCVFLVALLFAGLSTPAFAQADASLSRFVAQLSTCSGGETTKLAVVGFDRSEMAVSPEEAENLRFAIEAELLSAGYNLTSAADVTRLKAMREGTTGLDPADAENQIRAAFSGQTLFFVGARREKNDIAFRLQAITPDAACKATSDELKRGIASAGEADPLQVMRRSFQALLDTAPDIRRIVIRPVASGAGYSACADALGGLMKVVATEAARDPNRVLSGKTLETVSDGDAKSDDGTSVAAKGRFDLDAAGRAYFSLDFERGNAIIAPGIRQPIAIGGLGCDPAIRPFIDHVAATARSDTSRMAMTASVFRVGERLDVTIQLKQEAQLYCLVFGSDGTGYALYPTGDGQAPPFAPGNYRYPRDLQLEDILLDQVSDNLMSCFAVPRAAPPALATDWQRFAPSTGKPPVLLQPGIALALLQTLRETPGIVEAFARVTVK